MDVVSKTLVSYLNSYSLIGGYAESGIADALGYGRRKQRV